MSQQPLRPIKKPNGSLFSSGPCQKRPGWSVSALKDALVGRSHRSVAGRNKLNKVIQLSRDILGIPSDYRIAIVPGSDTGAMEMAMWGLLGGKGIDVFSWENFSHNWLIDITDQLGLEDVRSFAAGYGKIPDLSQADPERDVVFAWNGTSSGVRVPNGDWIAEKRTGLTICDATSAAFAMALPWEKLDVTTWSWQKTLGGEAAHGMIALSPRAAERLVNHIPKWPMPKLFRMVNKGMLTENLFEGETINTPSLLAVEDALDGLKWADSIGGLVALEQRCIENLEVFTSWVNNSQWCSFLAEDAAIRSTTSVCLRITDPTVAPDLYKDIANIVTSKLQDEQVAYDAGAYRTAPAGFRFWSGATIIKEDISIVLEWLDYFYYETLISMKLR